MHSLEKPHAAAICHEENFFLQKVSRHSKGLPPVSRSPGFVEAGTRVTGMCVVLSLLHNRTHEQHFEAWARRSGRPMIHFINTHKYSNITINLNAPKPDT